MRKTIEMSSSSRTCLCLCVLLMGVTWALAFPVQTSTPVPNIKVEPVTDGLSLATSEASTSERTSESSSIPLSRSETFTSERAPEIVTSEEAIFTAFPTEASSSKGTTKITKAEENLQTSTEKSIAKPPTNSQGEDSKVESTTDLSEEAEDQVQCLAAWDKFLINFGGHYHSEIEKEVRRNVFCDNWRSIRNHNKLFEQHKVPYDMDINQFSDLTFEEWRIKQMPRPGVMSAPEIVTSEEAISTAIPIESSTKTSTSKGTTKITKVEENLQTSTEKSIAKPSTKSQGEDSKVDSTTDLSEEAEDQVQCVAAWDKFLVDFGGHYHSEIEKEERRNVFCDNWRSIRNHNKLFEQHKVPYDMDINQFSDLTFEEWRIKQMPRPVVMDQEI